MPEENSSLSRVKADWSPLHWAVIHGDNQKISSLLKKRVNLLQKDSQSFTAIHRLLGIHDAKSKTTCILLAADQLEECKVQSNGLTHLHVASCLNNAKAVQKLMEKGADIEATLEQVIEDEKLAKYAGCTPLHVAMMNQSMEAIKELLQWGADIFAKKPDSISPLSQVLTGYNKKLLDLFMLLLWSDNELQQAMKVRESGLTMLHVACYALDIRKAKTLLKNGADVNARIDNDSDIWPGCTPFHVLRTKNDKLGRYLANSNLWEKRRNVFHLLLDNGADLTVADLQQCTPLQMIFDQGPYGDSGLQHSVLKRHLDFRVNPTDNRGLSYFHLACLRNNLDSAEKFLNQGNIEVNRPIDSNSTLYAGFTPLHLAVERTYTTKDDCQLRIVESLLYHGAKVSLKDSQGTTPLHQVMRFSGGTKRLSFMKKMLDLASTTDVNIRNIRGQTPMELLLISCADVEEIKLLLDHGGCINACNPTTNKGYIAIIFSQWHYNENARQAILPMILKSSESSKLDEMGRNAIHNAVAGDDMQESLDDLVAFITELIHLGCDIDQGDSFGKTALHLAVQFMNIEAIHSLLMLGADFNVVDSSGKSAFSYFFESAVHQQMYGTWHRDQQLILSIFIKLVQKFKLTGIEVSGLNDALQMKTIRMYRIAIDSIVDDDFFDQLRAAKNVKLGQSELNLRSFLCETGAISAYPSIMPTGRKEIAAFFENIDNIQRFSELTYLIQLQYRKAVIRLPLVAPAENALKILYRFPLPDLCVRMVLIYLSNSELKNLIAAAIDGNDKHMIVDE